MAERFFKKGCKYTAETCADGMFLYNNFAYVGSETIGKQTYLKVRSLKSFRTMLLNPERFDTVYPYRVEEDDDIDENPDLGKLLVKK